MLQESTRAYTAAERYISSYNIRMDRLIDETGAQGDFGAEFERMARQGRLTPDAWIRGAVGGPISAKSLLEAAQAALE